MIRTRPERQPKLNAVHDDHDVILPEDIDQESPEELIAFGKRAQVWNLRAFVLLGVSTAAMLLVFFFTDSRPLRIIFATLLMASAAAVMGTLIAVFALRTERKRKGI